MSSSTCLSLAAGLGFLAVLLGAFGAHGLSDSGYMERKFADVDPKNLQGLSVPAAHKYMLDFETAVRYHMWHVLALGLVGVLLQRGPNRCLATAAWCFTLGILLFSGPLYVLTIGGPRFAGIPWGMVAPIGGTLLMAGWLSLLAATVRSGAHTA